MKTLLILLALATTAHAKPLTKTQENKAIEILWNEPDAFDCDDHTCANYRGANFKTQICDLGPLPSDFAEGTLSRADVRFINAMCKQVSKK